MLMRIVWLAPVAMLLMLSAQPLMTTLSVALGATDCCAPAGALITTAVNATATRQVFIVLFIQMLLSPRFALSSRCPVGRNAIGGPPYASTRNHGN